MKRGRSSSGTALSVLALFNQTLLVSGRSAFTYVARLVFAVGLFFGLVEAQGSWVSAPGLEVLYSVVLSTYALIVLGSGSLFGTCITEEKETRTLSLLRLTKLNPVAILFGKGSSRLLSALLLFLVPFPFALLTRTLGGVSTEQILACYASLGAYLFLAANLGIFFSVWFRRSRLAGGATLLCLFVHFIIWWSLFIMGVMGGFAGGAAPRGVLPDALDMVAASHPLTILLSILGSGGFASPLLGGTYVNVQTVSNLGIGVLLFFAAWWVFHLRGRDEESRSSGKVAKLRRGKQVVGRGLTWKDANFLVGGFKGQFWRLVRVVAGIGVVSLWVAPFAIGGTEAEMWAWIIVVLGVISFVLETTIIAGRIFRSEINGKTWPDLMTLPHSLGAIIAQKVVGCSAALLVPILALVVGGVLYPEALVECLKQIFTNEEGLAGVAVFGFYIAAVVWFSLRMRFGSTIVAGIAVFLICLLTGTVIDDLFTGDESVVFGFLMVIYVLPILLSNYRTLGRLAAA